MYTTNAILAIMLFSTLITIKPLPKMKHNLEGKELDDVLQKHLDFATRYDHDFSQSEPGT